MVSFQMPAFFCAICPCLWLTEAAAFQDVGNNNVGKKKSIASQLSSPHAVGTYSRGQMGYNTDDFDEQSS